MYYTADRETGTLIEGFKTLDDARKAIARYEDEDRADDIYTPDFYDVVDEDHISIDW